jgi:hypothetical protein
VPLLTAFRSPGAVIIQQGTGSNLFDVAQLQANSSVNENSVAARFDYKFNSRHSMYLRYFRDQGSNDQPEGVTGRRVLIQANPQNGVIALQSILKPTLLNEFKFGFNGAYTRINGFAPTVNGIDLSAIALNISGNTANFGIAGQGASAGTAVPGWLVRANSATNGRGQPYTPYSLSFIDTLNWTHGNHSFKFGGEVRAIRLYTDRLGGMTYTYSNIAGFLANTPQSVQFLGDVSAPSPFNGGATGQRFAKQDYYIAYAQDEWRIRTEVFNIFNMTNFAAPSSTLNNALGAGTNLLQPGQPFTQAAAGSTFGLLRQTIERTVGLGTNRQIQCALRLNF